MTSYDITRRVGKHWNGVKISRLQTLVVVCTLSMSPSDTFTGDVTP